MKIIFSGHNNISLLKHNASLSREQRVLRLSQYLCDSGYEVEIITKSSSSIQRFKNIEIRKKTIIRLLWALWEQQPDVLHMHGWKHVALAWLMALLSPMTTYIWTVDTVPKKWKLLAKLISWQAQIVCDAITTPSRYIQYQIRYRFGLEATYIPDTLSPQTAPEINLKHFGVRKGQYVVSVASNTEEIAWLAESYASSRTKKPLLVLVPGIEGEQKSSRRYPYMRVMPLPGERALASLAHHAAVVLAISYKTPLALLLEAMQAERAIIAITHPFFEETLGVTAQYIKPGDTLAFKEALNSVAPSRVSQLIWGRQAKKRVRHFYAERVLPEYVKLYKKRDAVTIPFDSVIFTAAAGVVKWQTRKV